MLAAIAKSPAPGDRALVLPTWFRVLSYAGMASGAFHGYRRNRGSIGWAIGWGVLGGLFPMITIPVSLAQGYGKPEGR